MTVLLPHLAIPSFLFFFWVCFFLVVGLCGFVVGFFFGGFFSLLLFTLKQ